MNKLIINKVYIFAPNEKKAKVISLSEYTNVITSNEQDGSDRGKSLLAKSIYHTLGADCFFDDKWDVKKKIYILEITIKDERYYIYRYNNLFKVYLKKQHRELLNTINRSELSHFLKDLFEFGVELPNRKSEKLEVTYPAYNYLLNYIDQDKIDGTKFASFMSLGQYENYKENVLYYHFGVYNNEYYRLKKEQEVLHDLLIDKNEGLKLNKKMIAKVDNELNGNVPSQSSENLQSEIEQTKDEYIGIITHLDKLKKSLIQLRNDKAEVALSISEMEKYSSKKNKGIKDILNHKCPICSSKIDDTLEVSIKQYNELEDVYLIKVDFERQELEINEKISSMELKYKDYLDKLTEYENRVHMNTAEVNDILRFRGFWDMREKLIEENRDLLVKIDETNVKINDIKKQILKYSKKKTEVNNKYKELIKSDIYRLGLEEIDQEKIKTVNSVFTAGGSSIALATVMWYMNLLKVKEIFNPSAIKFPIILDSPNNVESDNEKKHKLLEYIFEDSSPNMQLIVSTLGFDEKEFSNHKFNNIICLDNNKYELLNEEDFTKYSYVLEQISN